MFSRIRRSRSPSVSDFRRAGIAGGERHLLGVGEAAQRSDHVLHDLHGRHALAARGPLAGLQAGQLEQVAHQGRHPLRVDADLAQEALGVRRLVQRAVLERLDEPADRGERRAQLVRRVGHEVAADLLHAPAVGDVVEGDHRPVRGALHARETARPTSAYTRRRWWTWTSASRRSPVRRTSSTSDGDLALAHGLQVVAARGMAQGEPAAEALVGQEDGPLVVHGQQPLVHRRRGWRPRAPAPARPR